MQQSKAGTSVSLEEGETVLQERIDPEGSDVFVRLFSAVSHIVYSGSHVFF
ncbi:UNVERIFIED_CONTAM: hypothetical protein FKN15_073323 [Acipenser sinensis]